MIFLLLEKVDVGRSLISLLEISRALRELHRTKVSSLGFQPLVKINLNANMLGKRYWRWWILSKLQ